MSKMQSTVKRSYDLINNADGSVRISFRGRRLDNIRRHRMAMTAPAWLLLSFMVPGFIARDNTVMAIIMGVGIFSFYLWLLFAKKDYFIILNKEGITYKNGTGFLSWGDIKNFGVATQSVDNDKSAYIFAKALGNEVQLSGHMLHSMAEAILDDIIAYE